MNLSNRAVFARGFNLISPLHSSTRLLLYQRHLLLTHNLLLTIRTRL